MGQTKRHYCNHLKQDQCEKTPRSTHSCQNENHRLTGDDSSASSEDTSTAQQARCVGKRMDKCNPLLQCGEWILDSRGAS